MRHNTPKYATSRPSVPVCSINFDCVQFTRYYSAKNEKEYSNVTMTIGKKSYVIDEKKLATMLIMERDKIIC